MTSSADQLQEALKRLYADDGKFLMVNKGRLQRVYIRFSRPTKAIKTVLYPPKRFCKGWFAASDQENQLIIAFNVWADVKRL